MVDVADRRILGALRITDGVTGVPVTRPLRVAGEGLDIRANRLGLYVIHGADGLDAHTRSFTAPPAAPAAESLPFTITVSDPRGDLLPAAASIALPRRFDPGNDVTDLMEPVEIALAPSQTRVLSGGYATLRVRVQDQTDAPIRGALVEAQPSGGGTALAWGITNDRGETLVAVPGLPALAVILNAPGNEEDDELVTAETTVDLSAVVDPALPWPVDPAVLSARGGGLRQSAVSPVPLTPGRTDTATLTVDLS